MSKYRAALRIRAFEAGEAQPYRELRHFHVADRPFVMAYVQMAGETFSLWACLCGRDRDNPQWIIADDPRNRDLQSEAFAELAGVLNAEITESLNSEFEPMQIWVSNATAGQNLGRLSRVMRARQVSEDVSLAGSYLDLYAQSMAAPTSSLCIAATEALRRQRVTGQSDLEDANLAAQLVWWDRRLLAKFHPTIKAGRAKTMSVFEAAVEAERLPMGTLTSPDSDEEMQPLLSQMSDLRRSGTTSSKLSRQLTEKLQAEVWPIWDAIWEAHRAVSRIKEAPSADLGWQRDSSSFHWFHDYFTRGGKRTFTDSPIRAAKLLATWEAAQADAARAQVAEDRLALVEAVLDNNAVIGVVTAVSEKKNGKSKHPVLTVDVDDTELTKGVDLWWRDNLKVKGEIVAVETVKAGVRLTIEITGGMRNNVLPAWGDEVVFITLAPSFPIRPPMPESPPWTHRAKAEVVDDDE